MVIEHGACTDLDQSVTIGQLPEPPLVSLPPETVPPETAPPIKEIPRTGDGVGRALADLGSVAFVIGVSLICVAWWRRPDADIGPILES